jgi:hypothetical protein
MRVKVNIQKRKNFGYKRGGIRWLKNKKISKKNRKKPKSKSERKREANPIKNECQIIHRHFACMFNYE